MGADLAASCGLFCGNCEHLKTKCNGCTNQKGKPFWTTLMNIDCCPLYNCCVNTKQLEHCGLCAQFPCVTFNELRDPSLNDQEAQKALLERQNDLRKRKEIGTKQWLKNRKTSYNSTSFTDSNERSTIACMSSFSSAL